MYHQYYYLFAALTVTFNLSWYHLNAGQSAKETTLCMQIDYGYSACRYFFCHGKNFLEPQYTSTPLLNKLHALLSCWCCYVTGLVITRMPNEVLEKIFKIVLMSSTILFACNVCHAYQKLCGGNKWFTAVAWNLTWMFSLGFISPEDYNLTY